MENRYYTAIEHPYYAKPDYYDINMEYYRKGQELKDLRYELQHELPYQKAAKLFAYMEELCGRTIYHVNQNNQWDKIEDQLTVIETDKIIGHEVTYIDYTHHEERVYKIEKSASPLYCTHIIRNGKDIPIQLEFKSKTILDLKYKPHEDKLRERD